MRVGITLQHRQQWRDIVRAESFLKCTRSFRRFAKIRRQAMCNRLNKYRLYNFCFYINFDFSTSPRLLGIPEVRSAVSEAKIPSGHFHLCFHSIPAPKEDLQ